MKRQRIRNAEYRELFDNNNDDNGHVDEHQRHDQRSNIPMHTQQRMIRRENVLEAQIQNGDTLQAIALRYNCTISDLKRLNKIEKEIEIHARTTIKVPVNAHSILLNTENFDALPTVHKSGQSSPKHANDAGINMQHENSGSNVDGIQRNTSQNPLLPNDRYKLDEKLLIASVSLASSAGGNSIGNENPQSTVTNGSSNINDIILESDILSRYKYSDVGSSRTDGCGDRASDDDEVDSLLADPLLANGDDEHGQRIRYSGGPHAIRGAPRSDFTCSGSDCDISWIVLLVFILAMCFAIPLIYVIYIAEHPEQFNHTHSD